MAPPKDPDSEVERRHYSRQYDIDVHRIAAVQERLDERIEGLRARLNAQEKTLENRLAAQEKSLDSKLTAQGKVLERIDGDLRRILDLMAQYRTAFPLLLGVGGFLGFVITQWDALSSFFKR